MDQIAFYPGRVATSEQQRHSKLVQRKIQNRNLPRHADRAMRTLWSMRTCRPSELIQTIAQTLCFPNIERTGHVLTAHTVQHGRLFKVTFGRESNKSVYAAKTMIFCTERAALYRVNFPGQFRTKIVPRR